MILNKEQIKQFLPHRDPFLFVDSIENLIFPDGTSKEMIKLPKDLIGTLVIGTFKVTQELEILKGHFPGNPILPGVVQVEMMAQVSAFVSLPLIKDISNNNVETLLLSVEGAKFRKPIVPEMNLTINSKIVKCRGTIASYECYIESNGEKISEATIMASLTFKK